MKDGSAEGAVTEGEAGRKAVKVSLTFQDFRSFITQYDSHISMGGMFIGTRSPLAPGTSCKLDVKLKDGYKLIQGLGEVAWTRDRAQGPDRPPGMGVRFRELEGESRDLIFEIVDRRLVDGSGVFQLEHAGEPQAQDIPDLEEILRRAERRREEAREADETPAEGVSSEEQFATPAMPEPAIPDPFAPDPVAINPEAGQSEPGKPEREESAVWELRSEAVEDDDTGSGEIVAEELAPELATGALFGEGLDWLKEGSSDKSASMEAEAVPQTSENALKDLDDLLRETAAAPDAPPTGELEALTGLDDPLRNELSSPDLSKILGAPVTSRPAPSVSETPTSKASPAKTERAPKLPEEDDDLFSRDLSEFVSASKGRPALPSELLAASGSAAAWENLSSKDQGSTDLASKGLDDSDLEGPTSTEALSAGPMTTSPPLDVPTPNVPDSDAPDSDFADPSWNGPALADLGDDQTVTLRQQQEPPPGPPADVEPPLPAASPDYYGSKPGSRKTLVLVVLGLLAAAAAAFFFLRGGFGGGSEELAEQREPAVSVAQPAPQEVQASTEAGEGSAGPAAGTLGETGSDVPGIDDPDLDDPVIGEPSAGVASTDETNAVPQPSPASTEPMGTVTSIAAREVSEGTLVTITANGAVLTGQYRYALIAAGSPRLLVRMLGVEKGSHAGTVAVDTDQVKQIRTGYHASNSGQDLHIVLDLASSGIVVDRVESRGNELLIWAESKSP